MRLINCKFCNTRLNKQTIMIWETSYCCIWCWRKKLKEYNSPLNSQESGDKDNTPFHSSPDNKLPVSRTEDGK